MSTSDPELLDSIYKYQRYIYDATRKFFLFGRDTLIREIALKDGQTALEVGVGTGRNLILLAKRFPNSHFYGIDASEQMLQTAEVNINNAGLSDRISLSFGFAEQVSAEDLLGSGQKFDVIFFSYSLSMIRAWQAALENARENISPDGAIHIVDFCDQRGYPRWFQKLLTYWLSLFHVRFEPELLSYLQAEALSWGEVEIKPVGRYYAYLARVLPKANSLSIDRKQA